MSIPRVKASSRCTMRWARGERLGEMILHAHLALQGREDRLDHEADARLRDLRRRALTEPVLVRDDELDAREPEALTVLTAAMAGVGEEQAAEMRAGEGEDALTLVLVGRPQIVAERRALAIADEQQAHAPDPAALGGAVAVGGGAGELAPGSAASVGREPTPDCCAKHTWSD